MNSRKSYLKIILPIAGLSAASIAVFTFPSCDSPNGKSLAEPQSLNFFDSGILHGT